MSIASDESPGRDRELVQVRGIEKDGDMEEGGPW